jgi:hypothetical protein
MPRPQFTLRALLVAMLAVAGGFGWLTECPVCHAGNVDPDGRCQLGDECPYYADWMAYPKCEQVPDDVYTGSPGHIRQLYCLAWRSISHPPPPARLESGRWDIPFK